jgi:hypothetical protein
MAGPCRRIFLVRPAPALGPFLWAARQIKTGRYSSLGAVLIRTLALALPVPVMEHRTIPESSAPVENTRLVLAGAGFHFITEQIFSGRGSPRGDPF